MLDLSEFMLSYRKIKIIAWIMTCNSNACVGYYINILDTIYITSMYIYIVYKVLSPLLSILNSQLDDRIIIRLEM